MKEAFTVFVVMVVLVGRMQAQEYFTFDLKQAVFSSENEIEVEFDYELEGYEESNFLVRPIVGRGIAHIYNKNSSVWVPQQDLWTTMPTLEKQMVIKAELTGEAELYFELQNTKDSQIYTTNKEKVWGAGIFGNYLDRVNRNIRMFSEADEPPRKNAEPAPPNPVKPLSFLDKMIKYIDEII